VRTDSRGEEDFETGEACGKGGFATLDSSDREVGISLLKGSL